MKRLAALLTLILWSVSMTASASASMSVLCVERDGHRAIEYSVDSHCDDAVASGAAQGKSPEVSVHCADCVDVPLVSAATAFFPKISDEGALAPIGAYVTAFLYSTNELDQSRARASEAFVERPAMRSTYIGQRKTIVIQQ